MPLNLARKNESLPKQNHSVDARFLSGAHGRHFAGFGEGAGGATIRPTPVQTPPPRSPRRKPRRKQPLRRRKGCCRGQDRCGQVRAATDKSRCYGQVSADDTTRRLRSRGRARAPRRPKPRRRLLPTSAPAASTTKKSKKSKAAADAAPASAPVARRRSRSSGRSGDQDQLQCHVAGPRCGAGSGFLQQHGGAHEDGFQGRRPLPLPLRTSRPRNPPAKSGSTPRAASTTRAAAGMARPSKGNS